MNKKAALWAFISFIPLIGQLWFAYRVSRFVIEIEEKNLIKKE